MNWQLTIVGVIIFLSVLFVANKIWKRAKSFHPKTACGSDCGCDAKSNEKSLKYVVK